MKPTAIMPAIMAAESLIAAFVYFLALQPAKGMYWIGAFLINVVWVWL